MVARKGVAKIEGARCFPHPTLLVRQNNHPCVARMACSHFGYTGRDILWNWFPTISPSAYFRFVVATLQTPVQFILQVGLTEAEPQTYAPQLFTVHTIPRFCSRTRF